MHTYLIKKGTTDVSIELEIIDSTAGTPETGVVWNTAGIDLQYRRDGAVSTAITEATLAALTTAHTDGGFLHIGNGVYRFDLPDAACASGVDKVVIHGTVTGMVVIPCVIQLTDIDVFDSVRGGMTALPNAAADAAGGVPISDAGGLDLDGVLSGNTPQTGDSFARIGVAGAGLTNIDLPNQTMDITGNLSGSVGSVTGAVGSVTGAVGSVTGNVGGNVTGSVGSISGITFPSNFADMSITVTTGLIDITQTAADKAWSTASRTLTASTNFNDVAATDIVSGGAITTSGGAVSTVTDVTNEVSANMTKISGSGPAADNLELSALSIIPITVTGTPTSTEVADTALTALTGGDNILIGRVIIFTSGNAKHEPCRITDYDDATGAMTVTALAVTPVATDTGIII